MHRIDTDIIFVNELICSFFVSSETYRSRHFCGEQKGYTFSIWRMPRYRYIFDARKPNSKQLTGNLNVGTW